MSETTEKPAAQPSSFVVKGGEAIDTAAIGAVLPNQARSAPEANPPQEKEKNHTLLKAVGAVLAVAIPAALIGKKAYDRSHGISSGAVIL
ncbi:MAG: hypothetical protein FJX23_06605 [Alphaproteobacteria bacterium]|nr:hypothetical protein [Alphaproteobacteria bacterium]